MEREPKKVNYDTMEPYSNQCRYRECNKETEGAYCSDQHKKLENSAKSQDRRNKKARERLTQ